MAADQEKLEGLTIPGRRAKAGMQMKSPDKKRRKSSTQVWRTGGWEGSQRRVKGPVIDQFHQGPAYSHLSEFAPPPTPMVDHLVASNPFEDDFGAPKVNAASSPFHNNPVPFGNFRMQGGMPHQVPPGYPGGPQPMRRQPPPFPPNQMGPGFGMPQNPNYGQPGNMNFSSQPFNQPMGQSFSPPAGQMMQGPVGGFGPIMSPTMGQPPRGDMGPGPVLNSPGGPSFPHRFGSPGHPFVQPTMQRPSLPPNTSPFAGADQSFPPGVEDHSKNLNPPTNAFSQDQHVGSPSAVNGNQPNFTPNSATRGNSSTPEVNSIPPPSKPTGNSGHQPPPGLVYPCGACRNEVNDDQDAILCEASCQKWFHRECTGMTESAYSLLTRESSAVWACDYCLKTKDIQSVYIREAMGQLVAANDG
ncbi:pygopus homolog 2 isoform X1 [Pelobates fuscus]|uniref:pygopus homolog 2 isoform X1 n=2 Tax=Pelobates fuscus TaxID=191477 RepID=UPI002FE431B6